MKKKVTIIVEKTRGENFYSCYMADEMADFGLAGYGKTAREAIEDLYVTQEETREELAKRGKEMAELEFQFRFDIGSFFNYYDYLSISGVARRVGVNASLMRRYVIGFSQPREERKRQIEERLHLMGKELETSTLI